MYSVRFLTLFKAFAAVIVASTAACGVFHGDDDAGGESAGSDKLTAVGGAADPSELTNRLGVFVAPSGAENADGSLEHPLARIQAGIDLAKTSGKRLYVCSGTYREAIVVADAVSIIGGLDCIGTGWRLGGARSRIEAPSSPAILANDILTPTRLDSLEAFAPNATAPSGSTISV